PELSPVAAAPLPAGDLARAVRRLARIVTDLGSKRLRSGATERLAFVDMKWVSRIWHDNGDGARWIDLRARRERPGSRCAAEQRDELAPPHGLSPARIAPYHVVK